MGGLRLGAALSGQQSYLVSVQATHSFLRFLQLLLMLLTSQRLLCDFLVLLELLQSCLRWVEWWSWTGHNLVDLHAII